jgi:translation initiation factor 1 (eIF-1/SUI1)
VYTDKKGRGTRVVTRVRLIRGDLAELAEALGALCGDTATLAPSGSAIVIKGNHTQEVSTWFRQLGF